MQSQDSSLTWRTDWVDFSAGLKYFGLCSLRKHKHEDFAALVDACVVLDVRHFFENVFVELPQFFGVSFAGPCLILYFRVNKRDVRRHKSSKSFSFICIWVFIFIKYVGFVSKNGPEVHVDIDNQRFDKMRLLAVVEL